MYADIIIKNAKCITVNKEKVFEWLAIKDEKIIAIDNGEKYNSLINKTTIILDAKGKSVLPGFIDSHFHLVQTAMNEEGVNLHNVSSFEEIGKKIKNKVFSLDDKSIENILLLKGYSFDKIKDFDALLQEISLNCGTFCFEGSKINPRITRQSGNFTHSGTKLTHPLDFLSATQSEIIKINIPYNCIFQIMKDLSALDITNQSIYFGSNERDLTAGEIKDEVYSEFMDYLNSIIE